jgi:hypothetical protein
MNNRQSPHAFRSCLFLCAIAATLAACSQGTPVINATDVQLLMVQDPSGSFAERLSLFVFFDDDDGVSDFRSISLTHNDTGLVWNITEENAVVRLRGKDRWTGSNQLSGPGGSGMPDGSYTLVVTDLAGNEAVKILNLVRPAFPAQSPVKLEMAGDRWILTKNPDNGGFTRTFFLLYGKDSRLLYSWRVPENSKQKSEGTVPDLRKLARDVTAVRCYTENAGGSAGVLLTPVNLR